MSDLSKFISISEEGTAKIKKSIIDGIVSISFASEDGEVEFTYNGDRGILSLKGGQKITLLDESLLLQNSQDVVESNTIAEEAGSNIAENPDLTGIEKKRPSPYMKELKNIPPFSHKSAPQLFKDCWERQIPRVFREQEFYQELYKALDALGLAYAIENCDNRSKQNTLLSDVVQGFMLHYDKKAELSDYFKTLKAGKRVFTARYLLKDVAVFLKYDSKLLEGKREEKKEKQPRKPYTKRVKKS